MVILMDPNYENAMIVLKKMVERSRVRATTGDAIRVITNLESDEINDAVYCLEKMKLVKTLRAINKVFFNFLDVTILPEGFKYYDEPLVKIESIK